MRAILSILIIFAAAIALYAPSWSNPFVLDDMTKIQENSDLKVPFRIESFIYPYADNKMHFRNDPSRPLTYMTYWVCWQIGQGSPLPFHVVSTLFHAATAALVTVLTAEVALLFFGQISWLAGIAAGLLFLTSPILAGTAVYAFGL